MANSGQQQSNANNRNYHRGNNSVNYRASNPNFQGAYIPNPRAGNFHRGNNPVNYRASNPNFRGAYIPNPQAGYYPNFHGGSNPNFPRGANPNFPRGANPNFPRYANPNFPRYANPNFPRYSNPNFPTSSNPNFPGGYNSYSTGPIEIMFLKFVEGWFKNKCANMENILRAFKSLIFVLENTHVVMTESVCLGLSMMEKKDKYKSTFNYVWKSLKLYKLFRWLYVNFLNLLGCQVPLHQEDHMIDTAAKTETKGVPYKIIAFFGVIYSAPYLISQLFASLSEDNIMDPIHWRSAGYLVKVIQDFNASTREEMSVRINDKLIVAPKCIQSEMKLDDSDLVFATGNGCSGLVPVKHLMIDQPKQSQTTVAKDTTGNLERQK